MKTSAFENFEDSIKSKSTRQEYNRKLNNCKIFFKIKSWDSYIKKNKDSIHNDLEYYISTQKKKQIKNHTIKGMINPIFLLLEMNQVVLFKKILLKKLPDDDQISGGMKPFTTEEIQRMLKSSPLLRTRALIHFLSSTGCRPASIVDPVLRIKHLEKLNNCYSVRIYDESKEGYWGFLTPEATQSLDEYLKSRKLNGEKLDDESPMFVNVSDSFDSKGQPITTRSVREMLSRVIKKAGIERTKKGKRYDKATIYGFRKRFNTILKLDNSINSNITEKLMAHKNGLDGTYLQPTREECFREFKKAITELTIDPTNRQQSKIQELQAEKSELEQKNARIEELENSELVNQSTHIKNLEDEFMRMKFDLTKLLRSTRKNSKLNLSTWNNYPTLERHVKYNNKENRIYVKDSDGGEIVF